MMEEYSVYGLRLKGDREVRYVGVTRTGVRNRFAQHLSNARQSTKPLAAWLKDNRDQVEAFEIAKAPYDTARATEKVAIAFCERMNHRLLNVAHVSSPERGTEQADAA